MDNPRQAESGEPESSLLRSLKTGRDALACGDLPAALRHIDRAWRLAPRDATILQLYAQVLLASGEPGAARRRLLDVPEGETRAEIAALLIEAALALGQPDEAAARLAAALHRYAAAPGGALVKAASRVIAGHRDGPRGWVGITPSLELTGEVLMPGSKVALHGADGALLLTKGLSPGGDGIATFRIRPPVRSRGAVLTVLADGFALIGSGFACPPPFGLDGRATTERGGISGWASLAWDPDQPQEIRLEDDRGVRLTVTTTADPANPLRRRFRVDPKAAARFGSVVTLSAALPDGTSQPLPDSPLILDAGIAAARPSRRTRRRAMPARRPIDIIVPVHDAPEETLACLAALRDTVGDGAEVIVVDDASRDEGLVHALDALAAAGSITLLRNAANLGFPATANRGLGLHGDHDAVLVNSDAIVHGDWLERLRKAAYSATDIGSVTPLTNCGTIVSYPAGETADVTAERGAAFAALAARINRGKIFDLPVGVGFCWFLRRDALADFGLFDEALFAKGYGEDNDLSMRARAKGWRHIVAADVFVRHSGGRSFGPRRAALMERNRRVLNLRHPGYDALVEAFCAADPLASLRRRLDETRLAEAAARHVLLLTLALPGGVDRLVKERCRALAEQGLSPLVLRPQSPHSSTMRLTTDDESLRDLVYAMPRGLAALRSLLGRLSIAHIEIHHFLDCDPRLVEMLMALDVPCDVFIHDYSWICPRLSLLGGEGRYCGEPAVAACERCIEAHGARLAEPATVAALRHRSGRWLAAARRVVAPSNDAATRLRRYFPGIAPVIEPWESGIVPGEAVPPGPRAVTRVALVGAIGLQKGFQLVLECARDAAARDLPLEFVIIGYTEDDDLLHDTGKVFVTGRYDEAEIQDLLRRERPDLAWLASVTPETWCFSLSHAIRAGVPIVAFDLGAIAERLRAAGIGTLIPLTTDPRILNDRLLGMAARQRSQTARSVQMPPPTQSSQTPPALSASVQLLTVAPGLYFFFVRAAAPAREANSGNLAFPAVHVALGPGASAEQVEFFPGPRTSGTWLCEAGNTLIAKVMGKPVTLVLTSIRNPDGPDLAIEVEHLDGRVQAVAVEPRPAIPPPQRAPAKLEPSRPLPDAPPAASPKLRVVAHLRNRGDVTFEDADWAGRVGRGTWIEAFTIEPLGPLAPTDMEYKSLTAAGFETPWVRGGEVCGTRGMSSPLVGFAVRLKPSSGTALYDCEYSGYFQSGAVVGPLKNGAPCRSNVANDPLEGLRVRMLERSAPGTDATRPPVIGPQFSKLREEGDARPAPPAAAKPAPKSRGSKSSPPPKAARRVKAAPRPAKVRAAAVGAK